MKHTERVRHALLPLILIFLLALPVRAACEHEYVQMREEPGCETGGVAWLACIHCGHTTSYQFLDPLGHEFGDWYVLLEPTDTTGGIRVRDCVVCGHRDEEPIPHLGHEYVSEVVAPTCTAHGYTSHHCPGCGDRFRTDYTDPLGHRYDDGTILTEPTLTSPGSILYTCTVCGDTCLETIPQLAHPFVDIDEQAFYYTPVIWAVNSGITSGLDATHFGPDAPCNRAQVVTFLWRSAGKPEPEGTNPFVDVPAGCFYEKAVLWAYAHGITTGTDATHFSPDAPCSRAQVVTFLHRFRGCPEPECSTSFPDVPADSFYCSAVLWAAQRGITVGMDGGQFCPDLGCNRAQIVTFLYRDETNP